MIEDILLDADPDVWVITLGWGVLAPFNRADQLMTWVRLKSRHHLSAMTLSDGNFQWRDEDDDEEIPF